MSLADMADLIADFLEWARHRPEFGPGWQDYTDDDDIDRVVTEYLHLISQGDTLYE